MSKVNIVFLHIGEKSCGDAIAIQFGDLESTNPADRSVVLIDGGYTDDWSKVVGLVTEKFKKTEIDLMISSHTDQDHINGLKGVVENIPVKELWMHLPGAHSSDITAYKQSNYTSSRRPITSWLKNSLQQSGDLEAAARAAGVPIYEPFTGERRFATPHGTLTVLGPSRQYYEELLPQILDKSAAKAENSDTDVYRQVARALFGVKEAITNVFEKHHIETLTDSGETTPSNNSSTIILLELTDGKKYLFTGDAGIPALEQAHMAYEASGYGPGELSLIQVPHHGSRHNVGPTVLDKFLGTRTGDPDIRRGSAFVSVGKICETDGHPKKVATNAFKRRGYPVFQTRGKSIKHGSPLDGFTENATPLPHFDYVEPDNA